MAKNDDKQIRSTLETLRDRRAKLAVELTTLDRGIVALEMLLGEQPQPQSSVTSSEGSVPTLTNPGKPSSFQWKGNVPTFPSGTFFGKSQAEAAVTVLRAVSKPLTMNQIVEALKSSNYPFKGNAYLSVYRAFSEDRRPNDVVKHGKLWGLRGMAGAGIENVPAPETSDGESPNSKESA